MYFAGNFINKILCSRKPCAAVIRRVVTVVIGGCLFPVCVNAQTFFVLNSAKTFWNYLSGLHVVTGKEDKVKQFLFSFAKHCMLQILIFKQLFIWDILTL